MRIEKGVMIIKDGKGWGCIYNDGHSSNYGWVDLESADIWAPKYCLKIEDYTYKGSPYEDEIKTGKLMCIEKVTKVTILDDNRK